MFQVSYEQKSLKTQSMKAVLFKSLMTFVLGYFHHRIHVLGFTEAIFEEDKKEQQDIEGNL